MKALITISIGFFMSIVAFSQSCLPDGITFNTQSQIDSFRVNFPNCAEIEGAVIINGEDIISLDSLSVLTSIGGGLNINDNPLLAKLSGLDNLVTIGGILNIQKNDILNSLAGLENMDAASITDLYIRQNPSLASCEIQAVCDYLANPGGSINIYYNDSGCNNPTEVAGACGITLSCLPFGNYYFIHQSDIDDFAENYAGCTNLEGNVTIKAMDSLDINNLNTLSAVNSIGGNLEISLTVLPDLSGLEALTMVGGDLVLFMDRHMTTLAGLENLISVGGTLELNYDDTLTSLAALSNLSQIGATFYIYHCDTLQNLSGLENLDFIGNELRLINNPALTSLSGLENIDSIGSISITLNEKLSDISSLSNIISLQNLTIWNNDALTNLSGLENLTAINGYLAILGNDALSDLTGLENLAQVGEGVNIGGPQFGGNALTSLSGMDNLKSIGTDLYICRNDSLENLDALIGLGSIGGDIYIYKNKVLASLSGLDKIEGNSIENLSIFENNSLSTCDVESICEYLADPNGTIDIHDNAEGCDSQEEVEGLCGVSVNELNIDGIFSLYPNPSSTQIILEVSGPLQRCHLSIFNLNGQEVITRNITESSTVIDIRTLAGGIYFVRLSLANATEMFKIVKY